MLYRICEYLSGSKYAANMQAYQNKDTFICTHVLLSVCIIFYAVYCTNTCRQCVNNITYIARSVCTFSTYTNTPLHTCCMRPCIRIKRAHFKSKVYFHKVAPYILMILRMNVIYTEKLYALARCFFFALNVNLCVKVFILDIARGAKKTLF